MASSSRYKRRRSVAATSTPSSTRQSSSQQPFRKKRETIEQACENCRKRKSKCNGQKPSCSACLKQNVLCEYNEFRASKQAVENYARLQHAKLETFQQLFDQLQSRSEPDALGILQRIRRGNDPDSVLRLMQDGDLLMQPWLASAAPSNLSTKSPVWSFAQREHDLYFWALAPAVLGLGRYSTPAIPSSSISLSNGWTLEVDEKAIRASVPSLLDLPGFENLLDSRFNQVSARAWTRVPCEDHRFSDLLRLYFIIEHPIFAFVDKDLFLDDLVAGSKAFCSPLLVNSILCFAAHSSHQVQNRHQPWNEENIGSHFYQEARRLWQLEEHKASITAIQAACILAATLNTEGKDKIGFLFLYQAIRMGRELGFFKQPILPQEYESLRRLDPRFFRGCAVTEWALLRFEKTCCFYFRLPPMTVSGPFYPNPYSGNWRLGSTNSISNSSKVDTANSAYFNAVQAAKCELYMQIHEVTCIAFPNEDNAKPYGLTSWKQLLNHLEHLVSWYDSLAPAMAQNASLSPQHLLFHMECGTLFQGLIHLILTFPPSPADLEPHYTTLASTATRIRKTLKELAECYAFLYNFRQHSIMLFHFFTIIAYSCLEEDIQSDLSISQLFTLCFNGIHDTTETVFLANTVLPPLEAAGRRQIGATWSPFQSKNEHTARRETQLNKIIERTYSAYPSDLGKLDFEAARADFVLKSMANNSLD